MTNTTALDSYLFAELDHAAAYCPAGNSWHAATIASGLVCECGQARPTTIEAPRPKRSITRSLVVIGTAVAALLSGAPTVDFAASPRPAAAYVDPTAELDTSVVVDLRGAPRPVPDLSAEAELPVDDSVPAQLVNCWRLSGAYSDPFDGQELLYLPRRDAMACDLFGWVNAR